MAGLINPTVLQGSSRALGVASEVRPALMKADSTEVRISTVERALLLSIRTLRRLADKGDDDLAP